MVFNTGIELARLRMEHLDDILDVYCDLSKLRCRPVIGTLHRMIDPSELLKGILSSPYKYEVTPEPFPDSDPETKIIFRAVIDPDFKNKPYRYLSVELVPSSKGELLPHASIYQFEQLLARSVYN